jgi:hypothetical protein
MEVFMSRIASADEHILMNARKAIASAQTLQQLRQAQAVKAALDKRLGRAVALASAYPLLHRHHWRQLASDKRHPKSDPLAQDGRKLPKTLTRKNRG